MITIDVNNLLLSLIVFFTYASMSYSQPVIGYKFIWKEQVYYPDAKDKNLFYYLPGQLALKTDENNKPDFLLTQMRYQGTACADDQGESRFFNLLTFTVRINQSTPTKSKIVKKHFGKNATLIPLPVRHISTTLVTSIENANNDGRTEVVKLAEHGVVEGGVSRANEFWTERSYSMKLQNHEAEIIAKQIKENNLALSLAYSYFADGIWGNRAVIELEGDQESIEELWAGLDSTFLKSISDTIVQPYFVFGDAFPIEIDAVTWPDLIKQIDLNEEIPPTYPAMEIRCYDFNEQLNPDLKIKKIEIHSTAVNGRPVKVSTRFHKKDNDITTKNIYFPFAVRMDKAIKYRTVDYSESGDRFNSEWTTTDACTAMIDITELHKDHSYSKEEIEIEINEEVFDSLDVDAIHVELIYDFKGEATRQMLDFNSNESLLYRSLYLWKDTSSDANVSVSYSSSDGNKIERLFPVPSDRYVYLNLAMLK